MAAQRQDKVAVITGTGGGDVVTVAGDVLDPETQPDAVLVPSVMVLPKHHQN